MYRVAVACFAQIRLRVVFEHLKIPYFIHFSRLKQIGTIVVYVTRGSPAMERSRLPLLFHCLMPVSQLRFQWKQKLIFFFVVSVQGNLIIVTAVRAHGPLCVGGCLFPLSERQNQNKHKHTIHISCVSSHIFGGPERVNRLSPNAMLIGEPIVSKRLGRPKSLHLRPKKTYHSQSTTRCFRCDFAVVALFRSPISMGRTTNKEIYDLYAYTSWGDGW